MHQKPKVAFVCVHNSCRSQIAEALGKQLAADVFDSYSAGTETKPQINRDAVRLMKQLYGVDMEQNQYSSPGCNRLLHFLFHAEKGFLFFLDDLGVAVAELKVGRLTNQRLHSTAIKY